MAIDVNIRSNPPKPDILHPNVVKDPNAGIIPRGVFDIGEVIEPEKDSDGIYIATYTVRLISREGIISKVQQVFNYASVNGFIGMILPKGTRVLISYFSGKRIPLIIGVLAPSYKGSMVISFKTQGLNPQPGDFFIVPPVENSLDLSMKTKLRFLATGDVDFNILDKKNLKVSIGNGISYETTYDKGDYSIIFNHSSGFYLTINSSGNLQIKSSNSCFIKFNSGLKISSDGKISVVSDDIDLGVVNSSELVKKDWVTKVFNHHTHAVESLPPPATAGLFAGELLPSLGVSLNGFTSKVKGA